MMSAHKTLASDGLAVISSLATIAAWQEQMDFWFKVGASSVAIAAGLYSIHLGYKKQKQRELYRKQFEEQRKL
jgi:hypothetical protein